MPPLACSGGRRDSVEVGNVACDPVSGHRLVAVQSRNQLAVIDPATRTIIRRVPLPGCSDDLGLALDSPARLAFIACDINSALLTVDMTTWRVTGPLSSGRAPTLWPSTDVLADNMWRRKAVG